MHYMYFDGKQSKRKKFGQPKTMGILVENNGLMDGE
jgi:hypothetical protein